MSETTYHPNRLAGSFAAGTGKAPVIHAVPGEPTTGYDMRAAVCGKTPGRRSCGWAGNVKLPAAITCEACRRALKCPRCNGTGFPGVDVFDRHCTACDATGLMNHVPVQ